MVYVLLVVLLLLLLLFVLVRGWVCLGYVGGWVGGGGEEGGKKREGVRASLVINDSHGVHACNTVIFIENTIAAHLSIIPDVVCTN